MSEHDHEPAHTNVRLDCEQFEELNKRLKKLEQVPVAINKLSENIGKWLALIAGQSNDPAIREIVEKLRRSEDVLQDAVDQQAIKPFEQGD